jgi:hypothetical protein
VMVQVSCRTQGMLKSVHRFHAHYLQMDQANDVNEQLDAFLDHPGPGFGQPPVAFAHRAHLLHHAAHANCKTVTQLDRIDWDLWILGFYYRELYHRCERRGGPPTLARASWVDASHYLQAALAHDLMGNCATAQLYLAALLRPIIPVVEYMQLCRRKQPILAGAIGFAFADILGKVPDHPAFSFNHGLATPAGLTQAALDRKTYCSGKNPGGALLSDPEGDLVPVELMVLNRALAPADQNPTLTLFCERIAATAYPTDPEFIALDTRVSIMGY